MALVPMTMVRSLSPLALLALAACGGTVDFSISRTLDVDTDVNSGQVSDSYDLSTEAGNAWSERSHIDSVSVRGASATVTAVGPNNQAQTESGTVWLLPDGVTDVSDPRAVEAGSWNDQPVTVGQVVMLTPSPRLDDLVTSALRGSGRLGLVATGDGGGLRLQVTLHVEIDLRLKWKP